MATAAPPTAHRIARALASTVLGVVMVLTLLLVLLGIFARPGSDGISRIDGHPVLTVLSGSMRPVFDPGDMIIDDPVTDANAQRLAAGNIITFHVANSSSDNLVTHRIVKVTKVNGQTTYQTKGDANNAPDPEPVTPEQIVGTYSRHLPLGGYLLEAMQKKTIFLIVIAIPLLYLVAMASGKHWRERDKSGGQSGGPDDSAGPADSGTARVGGGRTAQ